MSSSTKTLTMPFRNPEAARASAIRAYSKKRQHSQHPCLDCGRTCYWGLRCRSCSHKHEQHPMWLGGNWKGVKEIVLARDNYTCLECDFSEVAIMEVDHIIPRLLRPDLFLSLTNLRTLCPNCHRRKTNTELREGLHFKVNAKERLNDP